MSSSQMSAAKKSRGIMWLVAGVVALLLLVAFIAYLATGGAKKDATNTATSTGAVSDAIQQQLTALDTSIKTARDDQSAAQAAIDAGAHQTKVSAQ